MAKSLVKDVLMVAIFSVIARALGFLFKIYLSRTISAELLGVYHVAISVFMIFVLVVSSGIPVTVSKMTARFNASQKKQSINNLASSATLVGVLVSIFVCLVVFVFQNLFSKMFTDERTINLVLILLPAVVVSSVYAAIRGIFWGEKDYFSVGWTEMVEQIVRILLFVILFNVCFLGLDGATLACIALTVSCVVSAVCVVCLFFKKGKKFAKPNGFLKPVLKSSAPITGVRVASSLIQPIISILFPAMLVFSGVSNQQAMSVFGVAMGMTFPLLFLPVTIIGALSFALIPELSTALEKGQTNFANERIKSAIIFSILATFVFIPVFMAFGTEIGKFLYDNTQSGEFLIWASVIMLPLGLSNITSSILNALNLEVKSFVNNLLGGVCLILCIVLFTGLMGVGALILGFGVCMGLTTTLNVLMIKKHTKLNLGMLKPMLLCSCFSLICGMLSKFVFYLMCFVLPSFVSLFVCASLCAFLFLLLCVVFKLFDFAFLFSKINIFAKFSHKKHKI